MSEAEVKRCVDPESSSGQKRKLPPDLSGFRDRHRGETIVVCGCGSSLSTLENPERFVTIGVNDVGRLFDPTYLVVLNPARQFKNDRFKYVEESRARALFTQLELKLRHPHVVRFRLGKRGGTELSDRNTLPYARNSPYVALCLAAYMGARRIGLIGVDFTAHHFFGKTGRHPLERQLATINREYTRLGEALKEHGVEVFNLSRGSRLTAFPGGAPEDLAASDRPPSARPPSARKPSDAAAASRLEGRRVFFVHYQFLSCGDVFTRGLENAARDLGLSYAGASCDDPQLPAKVKRHSPELLFVVHGRKFKQRWGNRLRCYPSAVWLLDEPYEVDDTGKTSALFDTVFVNDPSTLDRHRNAHYLPVAYDPHLHACDGAARLYDVGFIGGYNPTREKLLRALAGAGRLSYVVGGPWKSPRLRRLCRSGNIPAVETAALYQQTRLVVNVFRDRHHYNRQAVPSYSLNPRVYEALACGALVVSEERPELSEVFPDLPRFVKARDLVLTAGELLADERRLKELLASCRRRLPEHTYAARLRRVLEITLGAAPKDHGGAKALAPAPATGRGGGDRPPTYSILMVVHNGLLMVRVSTLRTLRHIHGQDARLVVVDNGSTDGAGEWLDLLAQRGDVELIRHDSNIGHGPGLEAARKATLSPYLVTLDSDAFPLSDDWLAHLRGLLEGRTRAAGIGHHRGYVHPSCLMIARRTMDLLGLTFLNEKDRPSKLDVAERISVELQRRGDRVALLERTGAQRRGSVSEPVYLGSEYGGVVYHQWYTTRSVLAGGRRVDDVPAEALERSLREVLERHDSEQRELVVVMGIRASDDEPERLRNARAALTALNLQDLERWRYRIVVVEQDAEPRLEGTLGPLADRWIFACNPGSYNRGWAFNVGACQPATTSGVLCLTDADLLIGPEFLRQAVENDGARAVHPYREVLYLDADSTRRALRDRHVAPLSAIAGRYQGRRFRTSQGGCIWVDAVLYHEIGGHDERFRGWGREDREFWDRLSRVAKIRALPGRLLHLDHPPPAQEDRWALANRDLYDRLRRSPDAEARRPIGDPGLYANETPAATASASVPALVPGRREWEHWHAWLGERLDRIVAAEEGRAAGSSSRHRLASLLSRLGENLLDLGCGPGAMRSRLDTQPGHVVGVDVTFGMLAAVRRRFPGAALCQADGGRLPFGDDSLDVVLLRHVLEHLPPWLMEATLKEALRTSRRAMVVAFYVPPPARGPRRTRRVGEGFLETRWTRADVKAPIEQAGWRVHRSAARTPGESDEIWVAVPNDAARDVDLSEIDQAPHEPFKISIVLPTYRRPHSLPRTVEMIRAQTYKNWELIIVDNAGDGDYRFEDSRIRLYRHSERASSSFARNRGLEYASGELVCFFDDDDDMFSTYLENFAAAFEAHPRAKMVRCGMIVSNGRVNYSYATPECCLRREFATATWDDQGPSQDQRYFKRIVRKNRWSTANGQVVVLRKASCRANRSSQGGLRSGGY